MQPSLQLKKFLISVIAGGVAGLVFLVGLQTLQALQAIQQLWHGRSQEATLHMAEISQIRKEFGYQGLSRQFYRYLLNPGVEGQAQVEQALIRLSEAISRAEQLNLAPLERMAIAAIAEVAEEYQDAYIQVRRQASQAGLAHAPTQWLVDDRAAIDALRLLDELAMRRIERVELDARQRLDETIEGIYWGALLLPLVLVLTLLLLHYLNRISQANSALAQLSRELDSLLDNAPEAMLICTPDGLVQRVNARAEGLLAYPRERLESMPLGKLLPGWPEGEGGWQAWQGTVQQIHTHGGRQVTVEVAIGEVSKADGCSLIVTLRDISAQQRAQQHIEELNNSLRAQNRELETVNHELEAFSYSVSHDLRTPLRGIDGFSRLLDKRYANKLDAIGQDYLERITKATTRMGQIIDDMLQLSRTTRAKMKPAYLDLSIIAAEISEQLQDAEPEREVVWQIEPGLYATADPGLIRVALENLLGNAWKYSSHQSKAEIHFGGYKHDGEQVFFVRDNGAGFDMQYASKLFGAFQRLHGVDEFEGTGIGLSTVQRIIQRHAGRIWADAAPGQGACFYFTLGNEKGYDAASVSG